MNDIRLYQLQVGDIFAISIDALTPDILNNEHFYVLSVEKLRPRWHISLFGHNIWIPKPYKTWLFKIIYRDNVNKAVTNERNTV